MSEKSSYKIVGHPPLYSTPEEFLAKVNDYFEFCPDRKTIYDKDGNVIDSIVNYTITGLALYMGYESRQSFYDNEKRPEFSYIIKKARAYIEKEYEVKLSGHACTGSIFALKNMGWIDSQKIDQTISGSLENDDLSVLTTEELITLKALHEKIKK